MSKTADRTRRLLGFTVFCDFIQSEGIDPVLDNLERAGATAVAINPTVTEPSDDAGSSPRLFDTLRLPRRRETGRNRAIVAINPPGQM